MMNRNIKRVLTLGLFVALVFPFAHAQATIPLQGLDWSKFKPVFPGAKAKNTEAFCSKFTDTADNIATKLGEHLTSVTSFINEHKDTLKGDRDARDADLKAKRDKADQKRDEWYARLEDKATTDAEKNAVIQFKQTVDDAIDTRRAAVDAAIAVFRKGVDDAAASRKNSMQSTRDTFRSAVDAAVTKVQTDCDNGESTGTIRSNFKTSLSAAREKLKADKKDVDKVGAQVKALAEVRKAAVKKALDQFQTTLQAAIADLKKAFGE